MSTKRKLAAILSADAVGYSKLMADDEAATLRSLNDARDIFCKRIEAHGGRLIDTAGDSILAEFPSAVEAVDCAVEIQHELAKRNHQLAEHRRMQFRIGINLGDVIVQEDETIYGDGVNVAARLQSLAEVGAICISGTAFDQVEGKLALDFKFAGEQHIKNIPKLVRAYRVAEKPGPVAQHPAFGHRKAVLAIAVLVAIGGASAVFWRLQSSPAPSLPGQVLRKQVVLDLPNSPSIAVLPFANLSGDAKQEYFADGITEDIITTLSKMRLLVIARNSTFQYKGKAVDIRQVGRDLGVRHVLEGSVRREGSFVRVTAQLVDATTGAHLWSERYDRPLKDVFAVQDEITHRIVDALNVQVIEGEQARVWRKTTRNAEAYEYFLRGREQILRYTPETLVLAQANLETAVRLDPNFALAYTELGFVPLMSSILGVSDDPERDQQRALALGRKAVELDDSQGYSVVLLGRVYMQVGQLDKALEYGKKAVALEPNGSTTLAIYAHMLEAAGRCEEALMYFNKSLRLAPLPEAWIPWAQGLCLRKLGHYEEAIAAQQRAIALAPGLIWWHVFLVDAYVAAGEEERARTKAREILQIDPSFSVDAFLKLFHWYRDPSILKSYATNLRKAGLS